MLKFVFGIFLVLHGLVHLLYLSLSQGYIEDTNIGWSIDSWLLRDVANSDTGKRIALILYLLTIIFFVISGMVYLLGFDIWRTTILVASLFSSIVILIFWNGEFNNLPDQGFVGILINLALIFLIYRVDQISVAI